MMLDMTVKEILTKIVDFVYARVCELREENAQPEPKMYTYFYGLTSDKTDGYAVGAEGTAEFTSEIGGQVIDIISCARSGEFVLDKITVGAYEMSDGTCIPADCFGPSVVNRFVRFTDFNAGDKIAAKFRRLNGEADLEKMHLMVKVRSTEFLPS